MKVCLTYILPQINAARVYEPLARRFAESYVRNPPGLEPHEIVVISNGGPIQERQKRLFGPLPCRWIEHSNLGRDLGGFQLAAEKVPADLMIFFGSHITFTRSGWLDRIVEVFLDNGPGMYAPWGFYQPAPHLRTTAFWMPSELMRAFPTWIGDRQRYEAEHGSNSFTLWCQRLGYPTIQVTWDKVLDQNHWEHCTRENTLFLDQHCAKMGWK
jgi:hypothetical protein